MPNDLNGHIGFIGLGNMGTPMVTRLIAAGYTVTAFDVAEAARERIAGVGATAVEEAAAAVRGADVVILMLPNSQIVASVLADEPLRAALSTGTFVVDMSSSEPLRTKELAADLAASGIRMVDAPVSGGVKGAESGNLTIMVGGSDDEVSALSPLLEVLGRVRHAGPVGSGHAIKALNNLLSATHLLVTSEAMLVGERFGLDPAVMLSIFNGSSGRSGSTENKWPNFILPGSYDSGFGLRLMLKDMKIATALAQESGEPSLLGEAAVSLWEKASDALAATADHTEIAKWLTDGGEKA
jgi:3-hydroxyisobutyrate dehydrogenase